MVATPHFYNRPHVLIGTVAVECHFQMVTLIPEITWGDIETYCNPGGEAPNRIAWRGTMRVRMSYGADSAWQFFSALDPSTPQEVTIYPGEGTTAALDNPEASFDAYIGVLPFIPDHEVGASATFDLEFRVVGEPVFSTGA